MQSGLEGLEELRRVRQAELLHSLTVKLTETFPALRQAAQEGKKRRSGEELAGCPMHRIDDEQHVDAVSPFIPRYQENIITAADMSRRPHGGTDSVVGLVYSHRTCP